ncbi:nucleotidyl transferase AbiEii/AbiGii toxin family protein [Geothermobacter hydrogeniphilus]|uniref:nucleotidyl transferase AbiEii/AbiGii toxin family protein n=1 Tax=Geothermobacter hydrogeniphilus TaxID=1969733 RepID=UPI0018EE0D53|nr:nucleotidyl transferase AbiEii/AbiGii toxin family protein [Geothermobacter hydrogeniphilus]
MLDTIPFVFRQKCFAMKGGTAINLFCRNMPRLSVDIDLVFIDPGMPKRDEALKGIEQSLGQVADELESKLRLKVQRTSSGSSRETKLYVGRGDIRVKIEVNHVFRGSVYPVVEGSLVADAEEMFERELNVPMLDIDELYASKLVAALDRQHPRDLFDIMLLNENGGITPRMGRAFVVYLAGHNRPMHELLPPQPKDFSGIYEKEFVGMTVRDVRTDELATTRDRLFEELPAALDDAERKFLRSVHRLEPEWELLDIPGVDSLPALQWKLVNLRKLQKDDPGKFDQMLGALEHRLRF